MHAIYNDELSARTLVQKCQIPTAEVLMHAIQFYTSYANRVLLTLGEIPPYALPNNCLCKKHCLGVESQEKILFQKKED